MNAIQIGWAQDSFNSGAVIDNNANAMNNNRCSLAGTRHHPCGLTYDEGQCQFCSLCSQMQDDENRFLQGLGAALASEFESAWTQMCCLLATTMKAADTAHA